MTNYIYTPNRDNEFKCKVPLENTTQLFVVDGALQTNAIDAVAAREMVDMTLRLQKIGLLTRCCK